MKPNYTSTFLVLIFLITLLLCACKHNKEATMPQIAGNWTLANTPPATALLRTATGFIGLSPSSGGLSPNRTTDTAWFSSDNCASWSVILNASPATSYTLQVDLNNNSNVVAYSASDSTFYNSQNGGQTWSVLNHPGVSLSPGAPYKIDSNNLIIDSSYVSTTFLGVSSNRLFAFKTPYFNPGNATTNSGRLLKSDNAGTIWDTLLTVSYTVGSPLELYSVGNKLLLITYGQVLASGDNGATWSVVNSNSPVTFPGGVLNSGELVALNGYNGNIYQSFDTAKTWSLFFNSSANNSNVGPVIAFDSVILTVGSYNNAWHVIGTHPETVNWYGADGILSQYNNNSYTNLYVDNMYVYLYQTGGMFFKRPRTDFKGL